ncbi:MAG: tetratricopeptide repeat protein [Planctomycetota bacterium]
MLRTTSLILLLALSIPACGPDAPPAPPRKVAGPVERAEAARLVQEADGLVTSLRNEEALALYRRAADLDPDNPRARRKAALAAVSPEQARRARNRHQAGVNLMVAADAAGAYRDFREASFLDPMYEEARLSRARAAVLVRRYAEALDLFREILAEEPSNARAIFGAAEAAYRDGDDVACLAFLERLPDIEEQALTDEAVRAMFPEACYLGGVAAHRATKPTVALEFLARGLAADPANVKIRHLYGGVLMQEGRFEDAIRELTAVLAASPDYGDAKINLARSHERAGHREESIRWYLAALEQRPQDVEVMISLARVYEGLGGRERFLQAISWLDRAVAINPLAHEAYFTLSNVHRRLGNGGLADEYHEVYGRILDVVKQRQESLREIGRRREADPRDPAPLIELIRINQDMRQPEEMIDAARDLLRLEPENAEGLHAMSFALRLTGRIQDSYHEALKLIDFHPDDHRGWSLAAHALRDFRRWPECHEMATRAFDLDATDFAALEHLLESARQLGRQEEIGRLLPLYQRLLTRERERLDALRREDEAENKRLLGALAGD